MRVLTAAVAALILPAAAHAECVYDGVPSDYVRCIASDLATAQLDISWLLERVVAIEEGGARVWPADPVVHMRYQTDMCRLQYAGYGGTVHFPTNFVDRPIVVGTVDESLENSGATWSRVRRTATNQFSFVCDLTSDGYNWFALEEGVHEIDGKMVQAGRLDSANTHDTVFFPALFDEAPVIFLLPAGPNAYARVIGTPAPGGFDVYVDSGSQPLNWIAMEPGIYDAGPYQFEVGQVEFPDNGDTFEFETDFGGAIPGVVLTIQDTDNSGAVSTRLHGLSPTGFTIYVNHDASEFMNYIAFLGPQW